MEIRELILEEIRVIYKEHLCRDFPADELKPLDRMEVSLREGTYRPIGAFEEGAFRAYAFFVVIGSRCLLDYFGVVPSMRGKGIGTAFLKQVLSGLDAEMFLIEIEDPEECEMQRRLKRKNFYLNAGCKDTGVVFTTFGVRFLLLEYPKGSSHTSEEIEEGYKDIYRTILPEKMFERNILR